jgi:predicted nucleic acid-binding Zn ribbon protein
MYLRLIRRGRETCRLQDQHKITDDVNNERRKQKILSVVLAVIIIVIAIGVVISLLR